MMNFLKLNAQGIVCRRDIPVPIVMNGSAREPLNYSPTLNATGQECAYLKKAKRMALKMPTIEATCPIQKMNIHLMMSVFVSASRLSNLSSNFSRSLFVAIWLNKAELFVSRALSIASEILAACFSSKAGRSSSKTFNVLAYAIKTSCCEILNCLRGFVKLPLSQKSRGLFRRMMFSLVIGDKRERNSEHAHDDKKYSESIHFYSPLSKDKPARINTANDLFSRMMFLFVIKRINNKNAENNGNRYKRQHSESKSVHFYSSFSKVMPKNKIKMKKIRNKLTFQNLTVGEVKGVIIAKAKTILAQSCKVLARFFRCSILNFILNCHTNWSLCQIEPTVIVSAGSVGGNISAGLRSELFFETLRKKGVWQKIKGWFEK